ncbi:hypothetical protein ACOMHN_028687 [Nucella lapillus]
MEPKDRKMASLNQLVLLMIATFCLVNASSDDLKRPSLDLNEVQSCKDSCDNYAFKHAGGKGNSAECCARGCRFYAILSFVHNYRDSNATQTDCAANCEEAYSRQTDRQACQWGCRSQRDSSEATRENSQQGQPGEDDDLGMTHMLYPLLYMHSVYSNMLDKVHGHMMVSWSLFTHPSSGQLVVIRSQPRFIEFVPANAQERSEGVSSVDGKTSAYMETNMVSQDNSATPLLNFRASQMKAAHLADADTKDLRLYVDNRNGRLDWFTCVVKKTDIARVVLCLLILSTAVVMIWFCLSAASTAPEQHLSINGDLEYLRTVAEKDSFKLLHPQDRVEARPLPIKIRVEQI